MECMNLEMYSAAFMVSRILFLQKLLTEEYIWAHGHHRLQCYAVRFRTLAASLMYTRLDDPECQLDHWVSGEDICKPDKLTRPYLEHWQIDCRLLQYLPLLKHEQNHATKISISFPPVSILTEFLTPKSFCA